MECVICGGDFAGKDDVRSICPACSIDDPTLTLWKESIPPDATAQDSIRSAQNAAFSVDISDLPSRCLRKNEEHIAENNYEFSLGAKLGSGGIADVYTASQRNIKRPVAIKMVRDGLSGSGSVCNALLCEAVVTGNLDHPNVVPVYDLCTDEEGNVFFVMKEVHGARWSTVMSGKTLDENLDILLRVADTIAYAHSKGVLHCDLKPQNVMLGEFGEIMVMDWGASCALEGADFPGVRVWGRSFCGTPAYMPPEIARGDAQRLGKPSDVYQLGAILYHIITGYPPHRDKDPVQCLSLAAENQIAACERESVLSSIAMKAMATLPSDRYPDVKAFQIAIREYRAFSSRLQTLEEINVNLVRSRQNSNNKLNTSTLDFVNRALENDDYELAEALMDAQSPNDVRIVALVEQAIRNREAQKEAAQEMPFFNSERLLLTIGLFIFIIVVINLVQIVVSNIGTYGG